MKYLLLLLLAVNGTLFSQSTLVSKAIVSLKLDKNKVDMDLVEEKILPNKKEVTLLIIPVKEEETEDFFTINTWIVLMNNKTSKIVAKKTMEIQSDAIRFIEFRIDTAPYMLTKTKRAFGIRMIYEGSSRPNPYSVEEISLFIEEKGQLIEVLQNYEIDTYQGEWDTNCEGEFTGTSKILIISTKATNGYFDITVNHSISTDTNYLDENGECQTKMAKSTKKTTLKYQNKKYSEVEN